MAIILTSAYLCLNAAMASQKLIEPRIDALQSARVALALMAADLRCACSLSAKRDFIGMHRMLGEMEADNIDFATHNYTPRRARQGDYCQVSFFLDRDPRSGRFSLWRRRNPTIALNPLAGGRREELAKAVLGLRFEYSDGEDWYHTWGDVDDRGKRQSSESGPAGGSTSSRLRRASLSGLPEAVRITLLIDASPKTARLLQTEARTSPSSAPAAPQEGPDTAGEAPALRDLTAPAGGAEPLLFQTVVRLNLAASSSVAASSSAASAGGQPPPDQTSGGAQ